MSQRVAVVTGANKGIGFAIVRSLCKQLDNGIVYLTARSEERGKEAVAKLNQEGLQPKFHQLDVLDQASIDRMRDYLKETHGGLDILVNNAAIFFQKDAPEPLSHQAPVTIETNFTALLRVCIALIPLVHSHGRIVNVSSHRSSETAFTQMSEEVKGRFQAVKTEQDVVRLMKEYVESCIAGDHAVKGWSDYAYGVAKMGVNALTRVQAADIERDKTKEDVIVTCCCPGSVATDMWPPSKTKGLLTIDEGAVTPAYLALLPPGSTGFGGKLYRNKALVDFW